MAVENSIRNWKKLYQVKAMESFNTRFNLLLFKNILEKNLAEIEKETLKDFKIEDNKKVSEIYIGTYWQMVETSTPVFDSRSVDDIYHQMKQWKIDHKKNIEELKAYYISEVFSTIFPEEDFKSFLNSEEKCDYCNLDYKKIQSLIDNKKLYKKHITRGWSLEIDRKIPNREYSFENCVWSCYWCNNAKTDEFSYDEFKKIGKVIGNIWDERLKN